MTEKTLLKTVVLCITANVSHAGLIIGGSTGNGDFNAGGGTGAQTYEQTASWHNASGAENINFTNTDQTAGSPQPNSRAGMPFTRVTVNSTGYTITEAGEVFHLSYAFGRGGGGWSNDESLRSFLFTSNTAVGDATTTGNISELTSATYAIPDTPQWTTKSHSPFYTATAADVGKTVYFGFELLNPTGAAVYPRLDVVSLTVEPAPPTLPPIEKTDWQKFVETHGLSGDRLADTDGDGQLDVFEFVHGGHPTNPAIQGPRPSITRAANGNVSFFTRETDHTKSGIPYIAEWTEDLSAGSWQNQWDAQNSTATAGMTGYSETTREIQGAAKDKMFFRTRLYDPPYRPNILLILADDLGYADVGFNGSFDIKTPKMDDLARNGTIFSSAYVVHPFCGPSRMGLFSGRYPHEFGGPYNLPNVNTGAYVNQGIPTSETMISTVLQTSGYRTGLMGKWHMGVAPQFHPNARGFDDFYGFLGGGLNYFGPYQAQTGSVNEYQVFPQHNGVNDTSLTSNDYITDVLTAQGVRFLNEAAAQPNTPFFLMMSYNAPHTPLQAKASDMAQFPTLTGDRLTYAGMVYGLDRGVGDLVTALKANGQYEKTLIIFLSDNGGRTDAGANNAPLRGAKGDTTEGGFRVPMFFHWPNVIPPGEVYTHPVTALDFYPTFARLAKATIPAGKNLDGKDIWSNFMINRSPQQGRQIYTVRHNLGASAQGQSNVGIRRDQWKALKIGTATWKLYNLDTDIGEATDLAAQNQTLLNSMVAEAAVWSQDHVAPIIYDSTAAEADWISKGMPHYDEVFAPPYP